MKKKKIPLILLPGLLSNEMLWEHQINHLKDIATIQVISSVQDTAQKIVQDILAKAPPTFALAGHSMGGWICLEIMRTSASRVSKLCLLNTTAKADSEEKKNKRKHMIAQAKQGLIRTIIEDQIDHFVFNPSAKNQVKKMFLEVGEKIFINQQKAMLQREECQSILPKICCSTLVIHASKDKIFSLEDHEELVNQIPKAKMAIIEDSGHMSPLEMPQTISAFMRFWLTYL